MLGIGFVFGSSAFLFKRVDKVQNIFAIMLFPLSLLDMSVGIPDIVIDLVPFTLGLDLIQRMIRQDWEWKRLLLQDDLITLIVISILYYFLGSLIYNWFEKKAKIHGSLGKY